MKKKLSLLVFAVITTLVLSIAPTFAASDVLPPSDVENVKAKAGNGEVTLSWDASTDNIGVTGYNIYYGTQAVTAESGEYTEVADAGNVNEFTVKSLENGKSYYFAMTAYDAATNESENYSSEASAKPVGEKTAKDTEAPQVVTTEALYQTVVKVVFTEEVKLPKDSPELAFQITDTKSLATLDVTKTMMASEYKGEIYKADDKKTAAEKTEEMKKMVILVTDAQKAKSEYKLEVTADVEDLAGNPVASGTSDTGIFTGSGEPEPVESADPLTTTDKEAPKVVSSKAISSTEVEVVFSEKIVLSSDPTSNFLIVSEKDADKELKVVGVVLDKDGTKAKLTTANQEAADYSVVALEVKDLAGNTIAAEGSSTSFTGKATETLIDKLAPENISNFVAKVMDKVVVKLTWTASANSTKDLADQMLYKSKDGGKTYDKGTSLGKTATSYELKDLVPGMEYWLKITAKDTTGNENDGIITKIMLPETGIGTAGLLLGSALFPSFWRKKKKQ